MNEHIDRESGRCYCLSDHLDDYEGLESGGAEGIEEVQHGG